MVQKRPNIKFRKTFSIDGLNEGLNTNPNTSYVSNPSFWFSYSAIVILSSISFHLVLPFSSSVIWTLINFLHSLLTFILFHWMKGGPIEDQYHPHKYDKLTFWEQLDETTQYTPARKFLLFVPCALFVFFHFFVPNDGNNFHLFL